MATLKIGTFNAENLFMRYKLLDHRRGDRSGKPINYEDFKKEGDINMLGWSIDDYNPTTNVARKLTAKVILENDPDLMALQEVENMEALIEFNRHYLDNKYPYVLVIDGNDNRQIDVGVLSRFDFVSIRTHKYEPPGCAPNERIFARDCLEVQISPSKGANLTMLVNHFTSKISGGEDRRQAQSTRVNEILTERFGPSLKGDFVVVGDLNNHYDAPELQPLLGNKLENVVRRMPAKEQWTYCYKKTTQQFDYILLSPSLCKKNPDALPFIERRGLKPGVPCYTGYWFGNKAGEASSHCAVFITLNI